MMIIPMLLLPFPRQNITISVGIIDRNPYIWCLNSEILGFLHTFKTTIVAHLQIPAPNPIFGNVNPSKIQIF